MSHCMTARPSTLHSSTADYNNSTNSLNIRASSLSPIVGWNMEMLRTIDPLSHSFILRVALSFTSIHLAVAYFERYRSRCAGGVTRFIHLLNVCFIAPRLVRLGHGAGCYGKQCCVQHWHLAHPTSIPRCVSSLQTNKEFEDTIRLVAPNTIRHTMHSAQSTLHAAHTLTHMMHSTVMCMVHAVDCAKGKSNQAERTQ